MHNVPADILALARTVVRTEASHTLPPGATAAKTAGPTTTRNTALLEHAASTAVKGNDGAHNNRGQGSEPPASNNGGADLPPGMGTTESGKDVRRHRFEPIGFIRAGDWTSWRRRQGVSPTTCFAVETILGGRMARAAAPLLHAKVVHKCHRPSTKARRKEWILGGRMMRHNRRCLGSSCSRRCNFRRWWLNRLLSLLRS